MTTNQRTLAASLVVGIIVLLAYLLGFATAYGQWACQKYATVDGTHTHYFEQCEL